MISITTTNSKVLNRQLTRLSKLHQRNLLALHRAGEKGVSALTRATPRRTGKTAKSWFYKITQDNTGITLSWHNTNINEGSNIAILLQYGHGTRGGGWVQGRDYINPSIQGIFDDIATDLWKEVTNG